MKKFVFVMFLWVVTFGVIGFIQGSGGEQISRQVAVQQVEDSEVPYHATRNLELLKLGACVLVAVPAMGVTFTSLKRVYR